MYDQHAVVHVAIIRADGGLSMMQFITRAWSSQVDAEGQPTIAPFEREATPENIEAEIAKTDIEATSWHIVDPADFPGDRMFRNAWQSNGSAISIDMARARDIHRDRIRAARAPLLSALDVAYDKADERGDDQAKVTIATQKQALRDAPADPSIDAAATPEELAAIIPAAILAANPNITLRA